MMPNRELGVASDMHELQAIMRARAEELNVSRLTLDEATGLPTGYSGKVLAPRPGKRLGRTSLGLYLEVLGLELVVRVRDEQRITSDLPKREVSAPCLPWGKQLFVTAKFIRQNARKGGKARAASLTARQRQRIARKAARARWGAR